MEMKITKVTKAYFETEGERVYFFEPLDEEMTLTELQEMMDEHEKFVLETIQKMRKEKI
jgi:predicted transcriptional regulator